ncbi:unnamed protein product [Penicillium olsonii]|uniref:gamma-glutamylcyclotransferase n=1 Tax=Penicillium olsonii TaxID=99116 RepID=A0A9W4MWA1_PENOL|nr:unnamed protein product [Penicillium olsonii]CAG8151059.1 unnamed protein product [Penicillium olsonii]CAG8184957.1 unnamed protein product [Penicillium olsonii]
MANPGNSAPASGCRFGATAALTKLRGFPSALLGRQNVEIDPTPIPTTTVNRRRATSVAASLDRDETLAEKISEQLDHGEEVKETEETVLYLAYGSNLASKTFRGVRGIKPLSQIGVFVPELRLTFDLPGVPYMEPCFAGTQYRDGSDDDLDVESDVSEKAALMGQSQRESYHKRRWSGPLVGVVYEVTLADYAKIIATEGGGRGYRDGIIDCYPFPENYDSSSPVPEHPSTPAFKARTLLSPAADDARLRSQSRKGGAVVAKPALSWWYTIGLHFRPDPDYAQPSARYLNLIKTGAAEHDLPISYQEYLAQIRTYHVTTGRQKAGKTIFLVLWVPWLLLVMTLSRTCAGPDGRSPPWLVAMANILFTAMWSSYDLFFAKVFGNGERTLTDIPA